MPSALRLPTVFPERFAVEWGQDEYGIFMGFRVERFVQRMRWIPPGSFMMGAPETEVGRYDDETQHWVELTQGIWLGDTPVTQALWEAVMGSNPSQFKGPTRPVEKVSWNDCAQFITRLNERVPGLDARLPTEAEWEYACRAGTTTATWAGDLELGEEERAPLLDAIAWCQGNGGGTTHPVAQKQVNPWGLYDMLGNVYEWCADWFGKYDATVVCDPQGPAMGARRVGRGGSLLTLAKHVRAANREGLEPERLSPFAGLRLARNATPSLRTTLTNTRGATRRAELPGQR